MARRSPTPSPKLPKAPKAARRTRTATLANLQAPHPEQSFPEIDDPIVKRKARKRGKTNYIYALADPRTGIVRYVGKTNDPQFRLEGHLRDKRNCARVKWLRELVSLGLQPQMIILEIIHPPLSWQDAEIWWIATGRERGWDLTNVSDGGEGPGPKGRNLPPPQRRRMSQVKI